jgi:hypothetical protein
MAYRDLKASLLVLPLLLEIAAAGCGAAQEPPQARSVDSEQIDGLQQSLRRNCDDDPDGCGPGPDPDDDPPPPPPPPPVTSHPDLAMELSLPVSCAGSGVADVVRAELQRNYPGAAVEFQCQADLPVLVMAASLRVNPAVVIPGGGGGRAKVGLWMRALRPNENQAARLRGLAAMNLLRGSETAALRVPSSVIHQQVAAAWALQPKHFDHAGNGNSGAGPVHLHGYQLAFDVPHSRIVFTATGHDSSPVPDLDFTYKLTDTFSVQDGGVQCQSVTDFDKDDGLYWALGGLFLALTLVSPWVAPFSFALANAFFIQGTIISSVRGPGGSLGGDSFCSAAALIPQKILLRGQGPVPPRQKMVLSYDRVSTEGGINAAGSWSLAPRLPTVAAAGTRYLDVILEGDGPSTVQLTAVATAKTDDMINPTFTFTTDPGATIQPILTQATFQSRRITWEVTGVRPGDQITRWVSVSATDAEQLQATGSTFFVFRIQAPPRDNPVCDSKPWLPVCQ